MSSIDRWSTGRVQSRAKVIQEIGNLLSQHFPITPDDINELPNEVMKGE